ncbi:hypothetical protein FB639_006577, partial [Coemansia asiatica]
MQCTFVEVSVDSDFSIHNLPYGVCSCGPDEPAHVAVAIGDYALDMARLARLGLFEDIGGLDASGV